MLSAHFTRFCASWLRWVRRSPRRQARFRHPLSARPRRSLNVHSPRTARKIARNGAPRLAYALLLSSSPVLGSAFTGNALLRSAVVTRRPAESGQDRFGLFPFDEFFAECFRSPRAAREGRGNPQFFTSHRHRRPCYPGPKSTAHSCSPKYSLIDTKKFHQKTLKSKKIAVRSDFRHRDCGPPEMKVAQRAGHSRPDFNPGTKAALLAQASEVTAWRVGRGLETHDATG